MPVVRYLVLEDNVHAAGRWTLFSTHHHHLGRLSSKKIGRFVETYVLGKISIFFENYTKVFLVSF